jgi:hypothetical protein
MEFATKKNPEYVSHTFKVTTATATQRQVSHRIKTTYTTHTIDTLKKKRKRHKYNIVP